MTDNTGATSARPRKLSLDDLIPEKVAVPTSLGILYLRSVHISDFKDFEVGDTAELGRIVVRKLANRVQDKRDRTPLKEDDVDVLLDADFQILAPAVANKNNWDELPKGAGLLELGHAARRAKKEELLRRQKMLDEMRTSIGNSYAFLGDSALEKLQEQMVDLSNIRQSVSAAESIKSAMEASSVGVQPMLDTASDIRRATDDMMKSSRITAIPELIFSRSSEISPDFSPPNPEDTVLGRATLEGAENSRETVRRMDALVEVVGGINQTLVKDVLPAWIDSAKSDQESAKQAFKQAGESLKWTRWAVIASVVATVLATWWQISVTHEIDRENSVAQRTSESLLREQLAALRTNESLLREQLVAQQKLTEQQSLEMRHLQELIRQQSIGSKKLRELVKLRLSAPVRK